MVKMHNNQNILILLFIIILIKTKNTEKALLISEDTNKAIYIIYGVIGQKVCVTNPNKLENL